jgi:hypothetical protein
MPECKNQDEQYENNGDFPDAQVKELILKLSLLQ